MVALDARKILYLKLCVLLRVNFFGDLVYSTSLQRRNEIGTFFYLGQSRVRVEHLSLEIELNGAENLFWELK